MFSKISAYNPAYKFCRHKSIVSFKNGSEGLCSLATGPLEGPITRYRRNIQLISRKIEYSGNLAWSSVTKSLNGNGFF